jgi:predicted metal-dependent enzyme (double-stranded beta helix superfamily)
MNLHFEADLDRRALRDLVGRVAAQPALWRPLVKLDAGQRHFAQLWRDDHVDVWVISWMPGHDTGYHDHDLSSGAVAVVDGKLVEERLAIGGASRMNRYEAGETFDFDAAHVHRMHQPGPKASVSIHAYSPPLSRMGAYAVEPDGTLRRRSISYAEELRPVETAA